MSAVFDILIVVILAGSIFAAAKKGFVKSIIGLAGIILAFALAFALSAQFGSYISKSYVKPFIKDNIVKSFSKALEGEVSKDVTVSGETDLQKVDIAKIFNESDMPQFAKDILKSLNITTINAKSELNKVINGPKTQATMGNFVDTLIDKSGISVAISRAIAFFLIFIGVIILSKIVEIIVGVVAKLPILNQFDKLLGAGLGIINGIIIIFILCAIVKVLSGFITSSDGLSFEQGILDKTLVFKFFYNINPFSSFKI